MGYRRSEQPIRRTETPVDALDLLIADHNRVRGLFARFRKAEDHEEAEDMQMLAKRIVEELEVHTTIEEEIFYPSVHDLSEDISDVVDEGVQEHHVAKVLIEELGTVEAGSDAWTAKMIVLIESVEHHAEEEEKAMFPKVRSASTAEQREDLGARLETRKTKLGAPTSADAQHLTAEELKALASEQEIPGRSSMDVEELRATVDPR
jgi:hemerythrin superfamily protein